MAKKVVGIDIDSSGIRTAIVAQKGRNKVVTELNSMPLPEGVVVDGKVANPKKLTEALELLVEEADLYDESTVLGVRSNWVTVKTHKLPNMSRKELDKALEFEIPELVSFPVESTRDVCFDYFVNTKSGDDVELVLVACPRENLNPYIEAIRSAGLVLESIDVPAFGWRELLDSGDERAYVEIGEEQTTVQVILDGVFKVLRVVPVGASHIRKGVQEAFECSEEQAKDLCENHDIDYLLTEGTGNMRSLSGSIQQFAGSVLQTLDFVRAQERATNFRAMLGEVVLVGRMADLPGIAEMLQKDMDIDIRPLKAIDNLKVDFDLMRPEGFSSYGSAIALGLRGLDL